MKQTFLALMKVAALLEEYEQLNELLKQHSKYLDRAPARVSFEFLNLGNPNHVSVESTALADKLHHALRAEIKKRIAEVEADLQRLNSALDGTESVVKFPRNTLESGGWTLDYQLLYGISRNLMSTGFGPPSMETIEIVLLAAEKYAQHKEETNGDT